MGVKRIVETLEESDTFFSSKALCQMMHRKGLNLRFLWLVAVQVKRKRVRELVLATLMVKAVGRLINEEVAELNKKTYGEEEFYQGFNEGVFLDVLSQTVNALVKRGGARDKHEKLLDCLFLMRLKVF